MQLLDVIKEVVDKENIPLESTVKVVIFNPSRLVETIESKFKTLKF